MLKIFARPGVWAGLLSLLAFASAAQAQSPEAPTETTPAQVGTGTLVVDVKPFQSEKDLPKKVVKRLQNGGLEWGVNNGQVVFTIVAKQFIDFPINHLTRYGASETLTLPAGEYRLTGIGLEFNTAFSVEKILEKGAYVNEDIVTFRIEPGQTTTLSILPMIKIDRTFAVNVWVPSLMTSAIDPSGNATEPVAVNDRNEHSIIWPNYTGPLKFVPKK